MLSDLNSAGKPARFGAVAVLAARLSLWLGPSPRRDGSCDVGAALDAT